MKKGTVYWITGLSGAGKTTIGNLLYEHIRTQKENVVILDGDMIRSVFGNDLGYSKADRLISAKRNAGLCKLLSNQGIDVICCTISMFHEIRAWNREQIDQYCEIYIKVPMDVLKSRNQKSLYSGVSEGSAQNVCGMDLEIEEPLNPDFIICNDGNLSPEYLAGKIIERIREQDGRITV